ncbi:MAG: family transcriptional regulator, cyclic receptor protein [Baekduia sp.]|nr:family transcriptional regulator, cyclic receptor protein [Baekduia sp.]
MSVQRTTVVLLDVEPELGEGLNPQERASATRVLTVPARTLEPGPWYPHQEFVNVTPVVGLIVVDGIITRDIVFAGRTTTELLGAGDLLRPWDDDAQFDALPFGASWHVHVRAQIAILDTRVAMAAGRWPPIATALGARHVRRARGLAFQRAVSQLPRVEDRLLVQLWALAERWGRVGTQGVRLPLNLPHRTLATLIGARRPSVTTALTGLTRAGLVERLSDGWLLHGDPADVLPDRLEGVERVLD